MQLANTTAIVTGGASGLGAATAAHSWSMLWSALVLGTLIGAGHGLLRLSRRRPGGFPYAPSMLAGAYLACWWV